MSENDKLLFAAVLIQIALTVTVYLFLVRARFAAAKDPATDRNRIGFDQSAWPVKAQLLANSVASQFELPVLFYVAVLIYMETGMADALAVALGFLFAISRIIHAYIHTGSNVIIRRFQVFFAGFVCVILMWCWLAYKVISG